MFKGRVFNFITEMAGWMTDTSSLWTFRKNHFGQVPGPLLIFLFSFVTYYPRNSYQEWRGHISCNFILFSRWWHFCLMQQENGFPDNFSSQLSITDLQPGSTWRSTLLTIILKSAWGFWGWRLPVWFRKDSFYLFLLPELLCLESFPVLGES